MKDDVSKEQYAGLLLDRCCMSVNQLRDLTKRTRNSQYNHYHLPLSSLDVLRVEVTSLEKSKPKLSWLCLVRVWGTDDQLHAEVRNTLSCLG
jgi:hypothetical protein